MKKKFFLLFALTILCVLSFVFGSVAVFAEETNSDYSAMWNANTNVTITKDVDNGAKLVFNGSVDATYQYNFSIGKDTDKIVLSAVVDSTLENGTKVFAVKLTTSSNGTDVINFIKAENGYKVKVEADADSEKEIASLENITISIKNEKVYINNVEIGKSNITVGYSGLVISSSTNVTIYLSEINNVDFTEDTLDKDREYYHKDGSFISRGYASVEDCDTEGYNAVIGFDYNVDDLVFFGTTFNPAFSGVFYSIGTQTQNGITWGEETAYRKDLGEGAAPTKVRFFDAGIFKVVVKATNAAGEKTDAIVKYYNVAEKTDENSLKFLKYVGNEDKYEKIANEIITKITDQSEGNEGQMVSIGTNFYYPAKQIYDVVVSKYFDAAKATSNSPVNYTLYYALGNSTSGFASTTTESFELSAMTRYVFFVMPKDIWDNGYVYDTKEFEDYTIEYYHTVEKPLIEDDANSETVAVKIGAWEKNGKFHVPVFSFEITDNKAPEITLGYEDPAFIGQQYKIKSVTINASDYTAEYQLYYMTEETYNKYASNVLEGFTNNTAKKPFNKDSFNSDSEYYAELQKLIDAQKITAVKYTSDVKSGEDMEDAFDKTNLTFKPKKGYYYMVCTVNAKNGLSDTVVTYAISALQEPSSAEFESEWWKHNWKSVMYLSISAVSLVSILLLIFIKPKNKITKDNNDEV